MVVNYSSSKEGAQRVVADIVDKGGKAIAERGPEYFRQLQAKRKNRKGGRPKKVTDS